MRRRAQAAASTASFSALRPLLFVLVSLFLVLPMLIVNFVTLDTAQIRRWTESVDGRVRDALLRPTRGGVSDKRDDAQAIAALPKAFQRCAAVTRANLSSSETVVKLREQCVTRDKQQAFASEMVHYVYLPVQMVPLLKGEATPRPENFTMVHFAAVQSVRKHVKPTLMVLHYPATEPRSFWYTQCQRYLSLHRVLFPKLPSSTSSSLTVYQRRDVMQLILALAALRVHGGVAFTDFNSFVLRPTRMLRQLPIAMGRRHGTRFSLSPAMLSASQGNAHVAYIEATLLRMLQQDDARLAHTPLDQLLGELLLESVAKTAGDAIPNVVLTAPRVLASLQDADVETLVASTPRDTTLNLHDALAIHVPTSGSKRLATLQTRLLDFETLMDEPSLLRFAIGLNTSSELDSVLG